MCRALVVLSLSGRVACRPVVRRGVSWFSLPCVVFCCTVLSCGGVLSCSAVCLRRCLRLLFLSCRCASAVCVLGCRAVCSLSSPSCAVLCCAMLVPFRCAVASSVLFLVAGVVGSWCRCLLLGVCWWLWLPGVVVWWCVSALVPVFGLAVARRLPCGVLLPCAVSCGAVLPCGAVLWCPVFFVFLLFFSLLLALVSCCSPLVLGSGPFRVVSVSVLCPCGAVLVCLRRCSLFSALLPRGWLVFCVVACCVCLFAVGPGCPLLSPGGTWWLLVSCLGGVLWRVPGCCAAPCLCALCRLALRCCALCCFVLLRLVLPRVVSCPGALSVVLGSCAFWRRVLSRCVCFAVACRCVVLFAVVLCAVCALRCRVVRFLSTPPCAVLLCGPLSLGVLLPCAVPRGAVLPRGAVVSCPAALLGLFLAWVWLYLLEKPLQNFVKYFFLLFFLAFENKIKLYTTQHTRVQQDHVRCSVLRATHRSGGSRPCTCAWGRGACSCPLLRVDRVPPGPPPTLQGKGSDGHEGGEGGAWRRRRKRRQGATSGVVASYEKFSSFTRCSRRVFLCAT